MIRQTGRGWMPDVDQKLSPNYKRGRNGRTIRAGCMHIMDGGYVGSISWLCNPRSGVSAHFAVSELGGITQMVNVHDTAYANGLSWDEERDCWIDPEGNVVSPSWVGIEPPNNPNFDTFSIEHAGRRGRVWTDAMYEADERILHYVQTQVPIVYVPHITLIGHYEISPLARPFCPGPGFDVDHLAAMVAHPVSDVRSYRVLRNANIRESPEVKLGNIAAAAPAGQIFPGRVVKGVAPPGSAETRWVHRVEDQLGFMAWSTVEELPV